MLKSAQFIFSTFLTEFDHHLSQLFNVTLIFLEE